MSLDLIYSFTTPKLLKWELLLHENIVKKKKKKLVNWTFVAMSTSTGTNTSLKV